ncbi:bola protein [Tricharina praecox]|uniref:bola protein n=1 Tax=Tricharina praecox TaxID=43433 RepID=UPI00221FEADA|nr:bola protein [Tricharina praecox]KAI5858133.1 bola protein [Tricharina praecox]
MTTAGLTLSDLESAIRTKLDASHIEVVDVSGGCGQMFEAVIVSDHFLGKTRLMRHRIANTALKEEIATVHAWSQKLYTGAEWEKEVEKVKATQE